MTMPKFERLKITGPMSIEPVLTGEIPEDSMKYLIMGPTGAGKSSFIEALAGDSHTLSISRDQLAGVTQKVTPYHLLDVTYGKKLPVYVIDTPGFSDTKISEVEIIDMVRSWLGKNDIKTVERVLYLTPITDIRLAGSKRRTIEMIRAFLAPSKSLDSIVFVTTMWNTLHNDRTQKRADSNFAQLSNEIFKDIINGGANIKRFTNTRASALLVLDVTDGYTTDSFATDASTASPHLYHDLHERIEGAIQKKKIIESDLAQPDAQEIPELKDLLEKNYKENLETLTKFISQFFEFGPPPPGFEEAHLCLQNTIKVMQEAGPIIRDQRERFTSDHEEVKYVPRSPGLTPTAMGTQQNTTPDLNMTEVSSTPRNPSAHNIRNFQRSPTKGNKLQPTQVLVLKGLIRRLLRAAKRRGKKWLKYNSK